MDIDDSRLEWNQYDLPNSNELIESASGVIEPPDIQWIERTSLSALLELNHTPEAPMEASAVSLENERTSLTDEQKAEIKEKTGWPDEIINSIVSWNEYEIYQQAGLREGDVNGKKCLIRDDIDLDYEDEDGITNRERMQLGLSPLTSDGEVVELHHIGQRADSPLAELKRSEHRGGGNDSILHDKTLETAVHGEGNNWSGESKHYWKSRVSTIQ